MLSKRTPILFVGLLLVLTGLAISCNDDTSQDENLFESSGVDNLLLTQAEKDALYFMLEEEKLARDVYGYLGDLWGLTIFENIEQSEISHVNSVIQLLNAYGMEYNLGARGLFNNEELQQIYDELISTGEQNSNAALFVGATIEDLDIRDLETLMQTISTTSILEVFASLQCGSRNHLRSFSNWIENQGETYAPQFISVSDYDDIINSDKERCN